MDFEPSSLIHLQNNGLLSEILSGSLEMIKYEYYGKLQLC